MTGQIITCDHAAYALPPLLSWDVRRTGGVPCDSFSASCLFSAGMAEPLHRAVSFLILDGGTLLLHGIVDEFTISQSREGRVVSLTGRGYAARLLDNESRPVTYQAATLEEILRNHVTPYGVACASAASLRADSIYTVASGTSQWKALEEFCRTYGGFSPTFRRDGTLLAAAHSGGRSLLLNDRTAFVSFSRRENHYGVLSEALVIDKTRGAAYSVKNAEFSARGGVRRRVLYTPGQSTWAAMRYTGEYQIQKSCGGEVTAEVCLPGRYDADPGDRVALSLSGCGLTENYRVAEVRDTGGGESVTTTLTLEGGE